MVEVVQSLPTNYQQRSFAFKSKKGASVSGMDNLNKKRDLFRLKFDRAKVIAFIRRFCRIFDLPGFLVPKLAAGRSFRTLPPTSQPRRLIPQRMVKPFQSKTFMNLWILKQISCSTVATLANTGIPFPYDFFRRCSWKSRLNKSLKYNHTRSFFFF